MTKLVAFDTETFLNTPGCPVPPGVCGQFATSEGESLHLIGDALEVLRGHLVEKNTVLTGAFTAYDMAVAGVERPDLLPAIFSKYDNMQVLDVLINQALDHVARGHIFKEPDGSKMRGPGGEVKSRYGLELVAWQRLQRQAKLNDQYRLLYGELSKLPMEQWPPEAVQYPKDDVRNTYDVTAHQFEHAENMGPLVRVVPNKAPESWEGVTVTWPGDSEPTLLTHPGLNAYAGFCLYLMTTWGLRVDPVELSKLSQRVEAEHAFEVERFKKIGFIKTHCGKHEKFDPTCTKCATDNGKDNGAEIKRRIIRAYNPGRADVPCAACEGTGAVPKPKGKGTNQCKACSATGLDPGASPTTEGGGVGADRDVCEQSGDDDLSDFKASTNKKLRQTYIPFLVDGVIYPIRVPANVLVATARTSFGKQDEGDNDTPGLLQTFPRKGGARETIIAPEGWTMCSDDWNALEFGNLGQAQKWVCDYSPIVDAINEGKDPHSILGARMLGIGYDLFRERLKSSDEVVKAFYTSIRFGTKAGNFGFGGRMGAATFALTQRRQRIAGHGSMCRLMSKESPAGCGSEKITTWKRRQCDPVCLQCVEVSEELRLAWLETWQLAEYFAWVDAHENIQDGQGVMVTPGTGYIRGGLNVSAGCNQPFQHLGGIGAKLALCLIARECYVDRGTALYGCRPIVLAHDEIITLMPKAKMHAAAMRQTELMKLATKIVCPDVNIGIAPALMDRWYKEAEEFFLDPVCIHCAGNGWKIGTNDKGKPFRKQCEGCKNTGTLHPWTPPPAEWSAAA